MTWLARHVILENSQQGVKHVKTVQSGNIPAEMLPQILKRVPSVQRESLLMFLVHAAIAPLESIAITLVLLEIVQQERVHKVVPAT